VEQSRVKLPYLASQAGTVVRIHRLTIVPVLRGGAIIRAYDPVAAENALGARNGTIQYSATLSDALKMQMAR
jgi:hypothetical protein